jgi:hypothetical protein
MNLHQLILTENDCYKAGRAIIPKGVMVHSTGANNPNLKRYVGPDDGLLGTNQNNNHWNRSGVGACVHAFIGKLADGSIATYQTLPWNMRGWHCGKNGNNTHISFEICEDDLTDGDYFNAVYREAVELTAYLCEIYGLDPLDDGVVICHSEGYRRGIASGHADVEHWFPRFGKSMDDFRADVATEMEENMSYEQWKEYMERYRKELRELPGSDWSQDARDWAIQNGVFRGDEKGNAMWQDFITREQVAQVMERLHE